jgi:hypothetical protein
LYKGWTKQSTVISRVPKSRPKTIVEEASLKPEEGEGNCTNLTNVAKAKTGRKGKKVPKE